MMNPLATVFGSAGWRRRSGAGWFATAALVLLAGCATPVGVDRLSASEVHRQLTDNVLSSGDLSQFSENILRQRALDLVAEKDRAAALAALQQTAAAGKARSDDIFTLAELSFQNADQGGGAPYYLAAALYAYAYLFPDRAQDAPNPFDPRFRWAADIYNLALTRAFRPSDDGDFTPKSGMRELPFGTLQVDFDETELVSHGRRFTRFTPVAEVSVRGLRNRYRQAGIGAPLAAAVAPLRPEQGFQVGPRIRSSVTALLRFEDPGTIIASGKGRARLELYPASDASETALEGRQIPLESEPTAVLATTLSTPELWDIERRGFLVGALLRDRPTRLVAVQPYVPGRIPVVFVHGTASSAGRWADMVNDLLSDPRVRERFQFWFFMYETGNPIPYSALILRDSLRDAVDKLDPDGRDPALRQMVIVGHSQGGLLAKLAAVDTGDRIVSELTGGRPLEDLRLSEETRELVRRAIVVKPLPFVRRVVFIATPHRGSYVAGRTLPQLIASFVRFPFDVAGALLELGQSEDALKLSPKRRRFGSVYGMTPGSPLMVALSETPIAPAVVAHSIIAIDGDGPPESGDDGVVAYKSAHIDGVASELIVRSGHSCQANPYVIAEVRRILLEHAAEAPLRVAAAAPPPRASVGAGAR